jgi:hypothetical protein
MSLDLGQRDPRRRVRCHDYVSGPRRDIRRGRREAEIRMFERQADRRGFATRDERKLINSWSIKTKRDLLSEALSYRAGH